MLASSMGQRDTFVGTYNYMAVSALVLLNFLLFFQEECPNYLMVL